MARPHGVILTVAPDRVFARLIGPVCEMTPDEAERVASNLLEAAAVARDVPDGSALMELFRCSS